MTKSATLVLGLTIPQTLLLRVDQIIEYRMLDQRGQPLAAVCFAGT